VEITQSQVFPSTRDEVWSKLMDFEVLGRTLPGVESLEPIDEESCNINVKVLVPSITGTYAGTVRVVEKQPMENYRLRGEAKGRLGWVKGDAFFSLAEVDEGVDVTSTMAVQTGGVLSGVGQRFMGAVAKSMLTQFFAAFGKELQASADGRQQ
jgi:carbon monoxide dehydrogenase subunit G